MAHEPMPEQGTLKNKILVQQMQQLYKQKKESIRAEPHQHPTFFPTYSYQLMKLTSIIT